MITYTTTQARSQFSEIVNQVKYQKKIIAIWRRSNKAEVIIVPVPENYDFNITDINANSSSFDFLNEEPDIYSIDDLVKKYV